MCPKNTSTTLPTGDPMRRHRYVLIVGRRPTIQREVHVGQPMRSLSSSTSCAWQASACLSTLLVIVFRLIRDHLGFALHISATNASYSPMLNGAFAHVQYLATESTACHIQRSWAEFRGRTSVYLTSHSPSQLASLLGMPISTSVVAHF